MSAGRMAEVAFGLGSNVGDKAGNIRRALAALEASGLVEELARSALYRTDPWGPVAQDWYVNGCAVGVTEVSPEQLLLRVKALEVALGRVETVRWGPRVIDIDIIYYDDFALDTPKLKLPHPGVLNRAFVLVPLAELRPDRLIGGRRVEDAARASDRTGMQKLEG